MTAKMERSSNRAYAHTSHLVQQQSSSCAVTEEVEPFHYPIHTTESESGSEVDWDLECVDDDGKTLVYDNGSTSVPVPRNGPPQEPEASSLSAWAQGYREVTNNLRDSITWRGYYKTRVIAYQHQGA